MVPPSADFRWTDNILVKFRSSKRTSIGSTRRMGLFSAIVSPVVVAVVAVFVEVLVAGAVVGGVGRAVLAVVKVFSVEGTTTTVAVVTVAGPAPVVRPLLGTAAADITMGKRKLILGNRTKKGGLIWGASQVNVKRPAVGR